MNRILRFCILSFLILGIFSGIVSADVGPKPSATFNIGYHGLPLNEKAYASMFDCREHPFVSREDINLSFEIEDVSRGCVWNKAMFTGFGEIQDSQIGFGYMIPDEFRLVIYFSDSNRTFVSDVINQKSFNAVYNVNLNEDLTAEVSEVLLTEYNSSSLLISLIITLILEIIVASIFVGVKKWPKKILIFVILASVISLPIFWMAIKFFEFSAWGYSIFFIIGEILIFLFEAWFIWIFNKKEVSLKQMLLMSFVMNLVSAVFGIFFNILYVF